MIEMKELSNPAYPLQGQLEGSWNICIAVKPKYLI
jgi:hypothetical protein